MDILAFGLSYRTAAVDIRERVAFVVGDIRRALDSLRRDLASVAEAVILSTCNRTEVYCVAEAADADSVGGWLAADRGLDIGILERCSYSFRGRDAVGHSMRVAAGLDSQVLGEPQITGQFKTAYDIARQAGAIGPELGFLGDMSLKIAKQVRTETNIGRNPVSVASAAVTLARRMFPDMAEAPVLLIGAGENIDLVAKHVRKAGVRRIGITNRTVDRARAVAQRVCGEAIALADLPDRLFEYDLVVSSTGSPATVLDKGTVRHALEKRQHRPLFLVDLAVPRDIEPEVGALDDVHLYSIDALTEIIDENLSGRRAEAARAGELIRRSVDKFVLHQRVRASRALLQSFRDHGEAVRATALAAAKRQLDAGDDPDEVLEHLARDLANKLLHKPTVAIRNASASGDAEFLDAMRKLYEL